MSAPDGNTLRDLLARRTITRGGCRTAEALDADQRLADYAPALALEVLRLRERVDIAEGERDALRALRDGRPEAPTDAERDAAGAEGGMWVGTRPKGLWYPDGVRPGMSAVLCTSSRYSTGYRYDGAKAGARWYYIASDGRISTPPSTP